MNETIKTLLERRSVRSYEDTPVKDEDIELIVKCGQYAATGRGAQPWHFTVITNKDVIELVSESCRKVFETSPEPRLQNLAKMPRFHIWQGAPMAIIVSGNSSESNLAEADCANAVQNMAVAAKSLGLGSCYIAMFKAFLQGPDAAKVLEALKIPDGFTPVFSLAVGYTKTEPGEPAPRRENSVTYIR